MTPEELDRLLRLSDPLRGTLGQVSSSQQLLAEYQKLQAIPSLEWTRNLAASNSASEQWRDDVERLRALDALPHASGAAAILELRNQHMLETDALAAFRALHLDEYTLAGAAKYIKMGVEAATFQDSAIEFLTENLGQIQETLGLDSIGLVQREFELATSLLQTSDWAMLVEQLQSSGAIRDDESLSIIEIAAKFFGEQIEQRSLASLDERQIGVLGIRIAIWLAIFACLLAVYLDQGASREGEEREERITKHIVQSEERTTAHIDKSSEEAKAACRQFVVDGIAAELEKLRQNRWTVLGKPATLFATPDLNAHALTTMQPNEVVVAIEATDEWIHVEYRGASSTVHGWARKELLEPLPSGPA